jgi:hypothetical protein
MPIDWGAVNWVNVGLLDSVRVSSRGGQQFSAFQVPVGRCLSNGAAVRGALCLLDLLSPWSCFNAGGASGLSGS